MTNIEITSNLSSTHLESIKKMVSCSNDRLFIVSPFLASDMETLLAEFDFSYLKRVDLVTTFKPKDPEQLTKPFVIRQFMDHFKKKYPKTLAKVHIDNDLHGKVYIGQQASCSNMIISSANFTRSGLVSNHEWGVQTTNVEKIEFLLKEVLGALEYEDISYHQVSKACEIAQWYIDNSPELIVRPEVPSDILDTVYNAENPDNKNPKYFLKPLGTSEHPISLQERRDFSDLHQNLYFSKKKPKGVKKGDVIITTAIGPGSILSYFKVTGDLTRVTDVELAAEPWLERWPWYMEGKNQSQEFGKNWWLHNIRRQDVLDEFLVKHPEALITDSGGVSLGAINFGSDKVQVTKEFAQFLIEKIEQAERG